uniref:RRM domain-containing protein n=1 Tax=Globodera pallida TaxID=36090 RepID=A0A183BT40_GLOPA
MRRGQIGQMQRLRAVHFHFPEHAVAAWKALDGTVFMGRMLHIIAGEEKRVRTAEEGADADGVASACRSSFQRERHQKLKANDAKATNRTTWNALFLGTDAVAETLADNYEKRHLLLVDGDQQNSVSRSHGNDLDAARDGKKEWLFGRFGHVKAVLVPPEHGITALVEMTNARDAKCAFEALAYSKKQSSPGGRPLFLEWAPSDVFDEGHPLRAIGRYGYQTQTGGEMRSDGGDPNKQNEDGGDGTKKTDDDEPTPKESGEEKEPEHNKMLVRNVPFQANLKELSQLFSAFGELKFIRMPKKPGSEGHRGFCFVEFLAVGDARRAMDALVHSTHLYGRRLVLEWANQSEDVEEKRLRTTKRMPLAPDGVGERRNKRPKMRSF